MTQKYNFRDKFTAMLLLLLLLFPIASEATHIFSDHDHPVCNEVKTHIHALEQDCSICDFQFTAFNFTPLDQITSYETKYYLQPVSHYRQLITQDKSYSYLLRGPPHVQHFG